MDNYILQLLIYIILFFPELVFSFLNVHCHYIINHQFTSRPYQTRAISSLCELSICNMNANLPESVTVLVDVCGYRMTLPQHGDQMKGLGGEGGANKNSEHNLISTASCMHLNRGHLGHR
jgi:hypothetical protein